MYLTTAMLVSLLSVVLRSKGVLWQCLSVLCEFCHLPEAKKGEADLLFHILVGLLFELWVDTRPGLYPINFFINKLYLIPYHLLRFI
ncbi:hypothetical protein [Baia soyae]|uniref:hypothetical protein n=1 Tax=Baia soyae TaxID=1544746 RepID=UPI00104CAB61|nr:hypothetical protein [Baia soyae]